MAGARKVGILTDTGKITGSMFSAMEGATIVLLESNHDVEMLKGGRYPYPLKKRILSSEGHLSNDDAGIASIELCRRGVRGIILGHISRENNHKKLAYDTVTKALSGVGVVVGKDISLMAARRSSVTGMFTIK
jgi:phosphoribosyl 1,2-cyclic phosphodiesterase